MAGSINPEFQVNFEIGPMFPHPFKARLGNVQDGLEVRRDREEDSSRLKFSAQRRARATSKEIALPSDLRRSRGFCARE